MALPRKTSAEATDDLFDQLFSTETEREDLPRDRDAVLIERALIEPNPNNPRKEFPVAGLRELGESMRDTGQHQNIVLRPHPSKRGRYQLVAGERRWQAAAPAYGDIPVLKAVVRNFSDYEVARIQYDENDKREDISPIARARGLQHLYDVSPGRHDGVLDPSKKPTWTEVAASVGLKRAAAARLVALLQLDQAIITRIDRLGLSEKHGRALLQLKDDPRAQKLLLDAIEPDPDDEAREIRLSGNAALRLVAEWRAAEKRATEKAAEKTAVSAWTSRTEEEADLDADADADADAEVEPDESSSSMATEPQVLAGGAEATEATTAPVRPVVPIGELQRGTGFDQGNTTAQSTNRADGHEDQEDDGAATRLTVAASAPVERLAEADPKMYHLGDAAYKIGLATFQLGEYSGGGQGHDGMGRTFAQMIQEVEERRDELDAQIERLKRLSAASTDLPAST